MRRMLTCFAIGASILGLIVAAPAVAAPGWTLDEMHTPAVANGDLAATSCPTVTFCVAVGSTTTPAGAQRTLIETSSGSTWTLMPSPNLPHSDDSALRGVSCLSSSYCVAVGQSFAGGEARSLIETWRGTAWRITSHPQPPGQASEFRAVSCATRRFCLAVGDSQASADGRSTLVEQWDGSAWSVVTTPSVHSAYSALLGVDCASATWCTAVGNGGAQDIDREGAYLAVIETYDGTKWRTTTQSAGDIGTLHSVSCTSRTFCMAVGRFYSFTGGDFARVETWDGSTWKAQGAPAGVTRFDGVSCTTETSCVLVGVDAGKSYAATWNGTEVAGVLSPSPADLQGVSCATSTDCVAVGSSGRATIQRYDGAAWTPERAADGRGDVGSILNAVSCASATFCVAVGDHILASGQTAPLIEGWNGARWRPMPSPSPHGTDNARLGSVSCTSASWCVAAGYATGPLDEQTTLLETWNGTQWSIATAPDRGRVAGVSCTSASFCAAVLPGTTEFWDGTSWSVVQFEPPPGSSDASVNGIDCRSVDDCVMVGGYYGDWPDIEPTLVERWDGTAWHLENSPKGPSQHWNELSDVSCTSASNCVAVGSSAGTRTSTLIYVWDGSAWTAAPHPQAPQALTAVSCAVPGSCVAVGTGQLVETLAAGTWSRAATPTPTGAITKPSYTGVDCLTASACRLVGAYRRPGGQFALAESNS